MGHSREPIPHTCPQVDKIVGKIKSQLKQSPRYWSDLEDINRLQELAEEMQSLLEDCDQEFELLRRSNELLRNWGEQEATDCDKLEERVTCSKNERAFLDEIREKMELSEDFEGDPDYAFHIPVGSSMLFQSDFTKSNLKDLVNGKAN